MQTELPNHVNAMTVPPDDQRLPVSLHIITSVAFIIGAVSLFDLVVEEYYRLIQRANSIAFQGNFWGAIYLIGAYGLIRLRQWGAVLVNSLTIACATIGIMSLLFSYIGPMLDVDSFASQNPLSPMHVAIILLVAGYAWWQYRVLQRPGVVELFKNSKELRHPGRMYRFSLLHLLLFVTIAALVMFRLTNERFQYTRDMGGSSWPVDSEWVNLNYGCRHGRFGNHETLLDYVIITDEQVRYGGVATWSFLGFHDSRINLSDGMTIDLPTEHQLMELSDGQLRRSDARITYDELQAYLADPDAERSLDGLLEFVEELRDAAP